MSVDNSNVDLRKAMSGVGVQLTDDMVSKCSALSQNHCIPVKQMAFYWELYTLNNADINDLNEDSFASYRSLVLESWEKESKKSNNYNNNRTAILAQSPLGKRITPSAMDMDSSPQSRKKINMNDTNTSSPSTTIVSSAVVTPLSKPNDSSPSLLYSNRTNRGQVVLSYNPHKLQPLSTNDNQDTTPIIVSKLHPNPHITKAYPHMVRPNRAAALDSHLTKFTQQMIHSYSIPNSNDDDETFHNSNDETANTLIMNHYIKQEETSPSSSSTTINDNNRTTTTLSRLEPIGIPSQILQTNIGRICNEAQEGKMNSTSILLEGSNLLSNGARINLDVQTTKDMGYSLFPGQIVTVEGMNMNGRKMVAQRIVSGLPLDEEGWKYTPPTVVADNVKSEKMDIDLLSGKDGCTVWTVAGPYTTIDDLNYDPFLDLLDDIEKASKVPDVVILMGPFVDDTHPLLKDGENVTIKDEESDRSIHVPYETFFAAKISAYLKDMYEYNPTLKTQFVIVPSLQDAVAEPVYPQPPLQNRLRNENTKISKLFQQRTANFPYPYGSLCLDDPRIHLVSNPCTLCINGITIGMTSTDALFHLSKEEIHANLPSGSRLMNLTEHFLRQRSYYPLFPPPEDVSMEVNLDVTKRDAYSIPFKPDILILPSKLTCFANDVAGGTIALNPGYLVKGSMGGTYATMDIHPLDSSVDGQNVKELKDRILIEIKRV